MILQSRDFSAFELRVAGYQFPDIESDEFDANWLVVEGLVAPADERAWKFRDPALLTWEVEGLCNWLEAVASGQDVKESADFTEPNLRFEVAERDQDTIPYGSTSSWNHGRPGSSQTPRAWTICG